MIPPRQSLFGQFPPIPLAAPLYHGSEIGYQDRHGYDSDNDQVLYNDYSNNNKALLHGFNSNPWQMHSADTAKAVFDLTDTDLQLLHYHDPREHRCAPKLSQYPSDALVALHARPQAKRLELWKQMTYMQAKDREDYHRECTERIKQWRAYSP